MKKYIAFIFMAFILILFKFAIANEIPQVINYTGRLLDASAKPITSPKKLNFKIYDSQKNGTVLWQSSEYIVTPDSFGVFSVLLGSKNDSIGASVFKEKIQYLEIIFDKTAMKPRLQLASNPYSYRNLIPENSADNTSVIQKLIGDSTASKKDEKPITNASCNSGSITSIYSLLLVPWKY